MTTLTLLEELRAHDARLARDGETLRVDAPKGALHGELVAALRARKPDLLQVLWRVEAMRRQLPRRGSVPLLVARDCPLLPNHCVSCGDPVPDRNPGRCSLCVTAAVWVLREREYAAGSGASDEV